MARIILVTPDYHCGVVESAGRWPHLGFVYLAGELRQAGHEVRIYDAMAKNHSFSQIMDNIKKYNPDVVGTTAYTATMPAAADILRAVREWNPDKLTVIGGIHPTFCYEEVLQEYPFIDVIVRFEGEFTLTELISAWEAGGDFACISGIAFARNGEVFCTPARDYTCDLDTLSPAWDLLDWKDYTFFIYPGSRLAIVSTSRGCIHNCAFCSQHKFWNRTWRARRPESVVAEIEYLVREYDVEVFFISDEYPTRDRQRWEEILDLLIAKDLGASFLLETRVDDIVRDEDIINKYRSAGIIHIYVGIEAAAQENLDLFKKGIAADDSKRALDIIHSAGIVSETSFILGTPGETPESIARTLESACLYNPDFAHFLLLAPWPYADMYPELAPFIFEKDYSKYNLVEPVIKPEAMTGDELFTAVLNCYRKFYMAKIPEWVNLKNDFKRKYALQSMKAIMENSFLKEHILKLGAMPKSVEKIIRGLYSDTRNSTG